MIVERITWKVKVGCMDEVIGMMKSEREKWGNGHKWRLYTPNIGKFDIVAYEYEYESLEEMEREWQDWFVRPGTVEYMKRWNELVEAGGEREIWNLV